MQTSEFNQGNENKWLEASECNQVNVNQVNAT